MTGNETSHVMLGSNWYLNGVSFLDGPQLELVGFCWAEVEWVCLDQGLSEEEGLGMVNRSVWDEGESSRKGSWKGPAEAQLWRLFLRWL